MRTTLQDANALIYIVALMSIGCQNERWRKHSWRFSNRSQIDPLTIDTISTGLYFSFSRIIRICMHYALTNGLDRLIFSVCRKQRG